MFQEFCEETSFRENCIAWEFHPRVFQCTGPESDSERHLRDCNKTDTKLGTCIFYVNDAEQCNRQKFAFEIESQKKVVNI